MMMAAQALAAQVFKPAVSPASKPAGSGGETATIHQDRVEMLKAQQIGTSAIQQVGTPAPPKRTIVATIKVSHPFGEAPGSGGIPVAVVPMGPNQRVIPATPPWRTSPAATANAASVFCTLRARNDRNVAAPSETLSHPSGAVGGSPALTLHQTPPSPDKSRSFPRGRSSS